MANGIMNGENSLMFRHIGSILQTVIILLLIYFGTNVVDNGKAIAVLGTKLDAVVKASDDHDDRIRVLEFARD